MHSETILCEACNSYHLDHAVEIRAENERLRAAMTKARDLLERNKPQSVSDVDGDAWDAWEALDAALSKSWST